MDEWIVILFAAHFVLSVIMFMLINRNRRPGNT